MYFARQEENGVKDAQPSFVKEKGRQKGVRTVSEDFFC